MPRASDLFYMNIEAPLFEYQQLFLHVMYLFETLCDILLKRCNNSLECDRQYSRHLCAGNRVSITGMLCAFPPEEQIVLSGSFLSPLGITSFRICSYFT